MMPIENHYISKTSHKADTLYWEKALLSLKDFANHLTNHLTNRPLTAKGFFQPFVVLCIIRAIIFMFVRPI